MDPDQPAPEQSDLGPYCLEYRLLKNITKMRGQTTKVVHAQIQKILSEGVQL